MQIVGIGQKSFEQCAGFVHVYRNCIVDDEMPGKKRRKLEMNDDSACTSSTVEIDDGKKKRKRRVIDDDYNPLDATMVHPESYELAKRYVYYKCIRYPPSNRIPPSNRNTVKYA